MGTFHQGKGELHGITVVVEAVGAEVFVGRCDTVTPQGVILLDADRYQDGEGGRTLAEYLERAARFGVWKKFDRLLVPAERVVSVRRLGELAG